MIKVGKYGKYKCDIETRMKGDKGRMQGRSKNKGNKILSMEKKLYQLVLYIRKL